MLEPQTLVDLQQAVGGLRRFGLELLGHAERGARRLEVVIGERGETFAHA